ncbi:MAG: flagellar basal body P-ring protein FlgI [Gammaproteobacteria bacterium]|nr:flagellar basal body P-ring protein FlgI [Gammaproteobacteria bacterium]
MRTLALLLLALLSASSWADRIKDLTSVAGVRSNQLVGYGLVVGLQGTGDGADIDFTAQTMKSLLDRLGASLATEGRRSDFDISQQQPRQLDVANAAAVLVTAELPPFAKPGQRLDVNVSTIGKAESLRGGNLVMTRLFGVDGEVYALAQGPLTVTGIGAEAAGSSVSIGVPTAGRIPGGALVERAVDTPFGYADNIVLNVGSPDFATAAAIVDGINREFGEGTARAIDGASIAVRAPRDLDQRVSFMGMVGDLAVTPAEGPARVVVNSRTGTVVISRNVRVTAAAVNHGSISVRISALNQVSQPNAFGGGDTAVIQNADIEVEEPTVPMFLFEPGVELRDIVDAVNTVGAKPSSLIAILEALKSSGSLRAELVVI